MLAEMAAAEAAIRHRAVELLRHESSAAERIYPSRAIPLTAEDLVPNDPTDTTRGPVICVYTRDSRRTREVSTAPRVLEVTVELVVELYVASLEEPLVEDQLDMLVRVVRTIIGRDVTMAGVATDVLWDRTRSDLSAENDRLVGLAEVVHQVTYHLEVGYAAEDDLAELYAQWDLGPVPDGQIEAEDTIEMEVDTP